MTPETQQIWRTYLELVNRCRRTGLDPVVPTPHLTPTSPGRATEPGRRKTPVTPVRTGGVAGRTGRESAAAAARRCAAMSGASVGRTRSGETPAGGRRGKPARSSGTPRWSGRTAVHSSGWKRRKVLVLLLETQTQKPNPTRQRKHTLTPASCLTNTRSAA